MSNNKISELIDIGDFVAIDSSTTSLAFAYVHNNSIVRYGKLLFEGNGIYEKVADIALKTEALFATLPTDTIVIESSFYSMNPQTSTNLAIAQGAILGAASTKGVKNIYSVPPITWQRGIGNATYSKEQKAELKRHFPGKSNGWYQSKIRSLRKQYTVDYVNKKYNLNVTDDDVADALGIAAYVAMDRTKVETI